MAQDKSYVGDVNTEILVDCGSDVSSATVRKIKWKKPDNSTGSWDAALVGTNFIQYFTVTSSFDQAGIYVLQAYIEIGPGKWHGESVNVEVFALFD